jgi:uncharacterized repeat protein (TIGR01451 family)
VRDSAGPRRLFRLLALALLAGGALAAGPASAAELSPSDTPLPDSNFQGADGNQDDAAPLVDWQAMDAARRVRHNPDPNDQDSAFKGGSKEDEPGNWAFTTESGGVNPGKANIRDAWSVVDQPGGSTFLYLSFARQDQQGGGTTFLTFELNRDARLWDNGNARVPCRRTGDVLVSYEPQGNRVEVVIQQWVTVNTDAATGCATTGRLVDSGTDLTPDVDAQGAINRESITNYLPGADGGTISAERFGEASLNLAALLEEAFGDDCLAFSSIWMHSRSSTAEQSNMQDYVAPRRLNVRTCAASGVKFFDSNANGIRDPGERGIPRFVIWADYDDDGVHDQPEEPSSISDNRGRYVIYNIRPPAPDRTYTLRERLARTGRFAPVGLDWICSHPNDDTDTPPDGTGSTPAAPLSCSWGPINVDQTPNARGRNFGDWFPARLTLRKQLEPTSDPGRFDLTVNGEIPPWFAAAGDGARVSRLVPPGTYDVSEVAVPPTDPAAYRTTVSCRVRNSQSGAVRPGTVWEDLALTAGQRAVCTFRNIVPGSPAIAIQKVGPDNATAGDTLRYRFHVENIGDVLFAEGAVTVTDPACDTPPVLDSKGDDPSPDTLDPGDVWTYRCSNQTESPGDDCEPTRVDNTGTVTGTPAGGTIVNDDDSISVIIFCPDVPPPLPPEPVGPTEPGQPEPVAPAGPTPPRAGDAAVARALFRRAVGGCISGRAPHVRFSGSRIARVRVFINGRLDPRLTIRALERRLTPRVTRRPGRYRIAVRVTFERGSGTPSLTLRGTFRICARPSQAPRVTG